MTLRAAFLDQATHCEALGSPFMGQLLRALADDWQENSQLGQYFSGFRGDIGPGGASLPLRLAGGLHALVLSDRAPALAAVYPPHAVAESDVRDTINLALVEHEPFLLRWCQSPPQTNEVRRSAVLIPAAHHIAAHHTRPFVLSELGASAGLNLMFDQFALAAGTQRYGPQDPALLLRPDWTGPAPETAKISVTERRGVDLNPLDAHKATDALRLTAYLWPDQPHRMELTRAAIAVQDAIIDKDDAVDWLEHRLATVPAGHTHLIYHTVAWQYFPPDAQARGRALIEATGAQADDSKPLAWFGMENDGGEGAALTLRLWPGDIRISLGRADFHGRWVRWAA